MNSIRNYIKLLLNDSKDISVSIMYHWINPQDLSIIMMYGLTVFSTIWMCLGLNFGSNSMTLLAMVLNPMLLPILTFTLGLATFNSNYTLQSIKILAINFSIMLLVSTLYFLLSPIYSNPKNFIPFSSVSIAHLLSGLLMGFLAFFILKINYKAVIFSFFAITINWIPAVCTVGYGVVARDIIIIKGALELYLFNLFAVFLGAFIAINLIGIKSDSTPTRIHMWILRITLFLILFFGLFYGSKITDRILKTHNIDAYLYQGLNSKSFVIQSIEKDLNKNEITVYYSGIKSPNTQDEVLKKRFHVMKYNFIYQSI